MRAVWMTLSTLACVVIVFGLAVSAGVSDKLESDFFDNPEITVHLSHYFGDGEVPNGGFNPRGSVIIRSFRGPRFTSNQKDLTVAELTQLQNAADNDGYYFIKATVKTPAGEQSFRSFAYAKTMMESGLSDILRLHLNPNGEIVAIGYSLARNDYMSASAPNVLGSSRPPSQRFNTTVVVHHGEHGPVPDTAPYLEKIEQEKMAKERGEDPRDNRSFLAKYWMYIVPIAIMVLLSGASNSEEGGGAAR